MDVRVIAATNRDLSAAIAQGPFRSDLLYRLNFLTIQVPPLRKRREDLPIMLEYFVNAHSEDYFGCTCFVPDTQVLSVSSDLSV